MRAPRDRQLRPLVSRYLPELAILICPVGLKPTQRRRGAKIVSACPLRASASPRNKNAARPVARIVRQVAFAVANVFRRSLLKGSAMRLERPRIDAARLYCPPPANCNAAPAALCARLTVLLQALWRWCGIRLKFFVWIVQSAFYSCWIEPLVENTPDNDGIAFFFVVDALMETICQSAIIAKVDFINAGAFFEFVDFAENIVKEASAKPRFKTIVKTAFANDINERRRENRHCHRNAPLRISFAAGHGMGRSIPAATLACVFFNSRSCQAGGGLPPVFEMDDKR